VPLHLPHRWVGTFADRRHRRVNVPLSPWVKRASVFGGRARDLERLQPSRYGRPHLVGSGARDLGDFSQSQVEDRRQPALQRRVLAAVSPDADDEDAVSVVAHIIDSTSAPSRRRYGVVKPATSASSSADGPSPRLDLMIPRYLSY
jgi:hypothetical protein